MRGALQDLRGEEPAGEDPERLPLRRRRAHRHRPREPRPRRCADLPLVTRQLPGGRRDGLGPGVLGSHPHGVRARWSRSSTTWPRARRPDAARSCAHEQASQRRGRPEGGRRRGAATAEEPSGLDRRGRRAARAAHPRAGRGPAPRARRAEGPAPAPARRVRELQEARGARPPAGRGRRGGGGAEGASCPPSTTSSARWTPPGGERRCARASS